MLLFDVHADIDIIIITPPPPYRKTTIELVLCAHSQSNKYFLRFCILVLTDTDFSIVKLPNTVEYLAKFYSLENGKPLI